MAKPKHIELGDGELLPIVYEDRSVIAIDKPPGWMLVPYNWQKTPWNLQAAIDSSINAGFFWARSRNINFLRHIHRLDADTSGILLLGKSPGAVESISRLFEGRRMEKTYLAVVRGNPPQDNWVCVRRIAPDPKEIGRMKIDDREGKEAETHFKVLERKPGRALLEAQPITGRTHQIRIHLASMKLPIIGDTMYGGREEQLPLGLRSVSMQYRDPFTGRPARIRVSGVEFSRQFGFSGPPRPPNPPAPKPESTPVNPKKTVGKSGS